MELTQSIAGDQLIPDAPYIHLLNNINIQPIFIIGPHRSGTTMLHQFLNMTGCFNVVTPYHVLYYDQLLRNRVEQTEAQARKQLDELFTDIDAPTRIIDDIPMSPDAPIEYWFILRKKGGRVLVKPKNLPRFLEMCKKIQFASDPNKLLLLKSPWDSYNFMYIKQVVPNAKFIFIHRHPLHIVNSRLKTFRSLLASKNPYGFLFEEYQQLFDRPLRLAIVRLLFSSHLGLGPRIVSFLAERATTYITRHANELPTSDRIAITYEGLCADPQAVMGRIIDFLGVQPVTFPAYETLIAPRPVRLLPEVERKRKHIYKKMRRYYTDHGYEA